MRRAANVDVNQREIVEALRAVGATVQHLHSVGQGCPDLLVGFRGRNFVFEVKRLVGKRDPKPSRLKPGQVEWLATWQGNASVVSSVNEALVLIGALGWESL